MTGRPRLPTQLLRLLLPQLQPSVACIVIGFHQPLANTVAANVARIRSNLDGIESSIRSGMYGMNSLASVRVAI
jgi:hypothetical protein